ncbi:endolytic transglycosylase MltG [Streptomyces johnsoniae]|uniref:Endolytic murein transglycosylase n=1 Tax=Streptomyces johnsoniae TaxID=3075532 RepID=A0ABU2S599_9ACTN|nr:endolytic transglycosylase MltG [Streptomyces sp. DSM 41886]MDT0442785.1 endolytic transglycosylase MltG [Streptomyces sp. DSM 41886]
MTDYGRNPGSEPWYPDDPHHADRNWSDGQEGAGSQPAQQGSWEQQYDAQQQAYYPPQQYADQGGWDTTGGHYAQGAYPAAGHQGADYGTGEYQGGYGAGHQYPEQQQYPGQQYTEQQQYGVQQQYGDQQYPEQQYAQHPGLDPHPQSPRHGEYAGHDQYQHHQQHDAMAQQGGQAPYGQQQQRQDRMQAPDEAPPAGRGRQPGPDPDTGWDPGPDQGELDFFGRDEDEDDGSPEDSGRRSGRRGDRPKKRRGRGCMVAALLVVGGVGGAGYFGYQFYQDRFAPAPDYAGEGTGEVQVTIPDGATVSDMANLLREADVVRSHDAFVEAAGADGQLIQAGVYVLREQMSAESAVELLLDPAAISALIIPEGRRATQIYAMIDEYLGLAEGTTAEAAENADLGLPDWAEGDPEGFLFPARYDVGADTAPEEVLRAMVDRAEAEFSEVDLESQAAEIGFTPREVLIIASLIEAEGQSDEEFVRVSRVIHNRLDDNTRLEFDSTINYAMGRSELQTTIEDTEYDSPYNTYVEFGLPPGPIDNPGHEAIEAALNPADGPWLYFVTVREGDTRFTDDYQEHLRNVEDFNAAQQEGE